jgi:hypothetical protein
LQLERIPRMCLIRMRSQVQVLAGPLTNPAGQSVAAGGAFRVPALHLVHVAPCWIAFRSSHQERQAAHGQQSHTQGDGQAAAEDAYPRPRPPLNHHGVWFLPGRYRSV